MQAYVKSASASLRIVRLEFVFREYGILPSKG
jgi:hypothetical protein